MAYVPPEAVVRVHGWRRFNAAAGMAAAPNTFDPDWSTAAGHDYIEGVVSLAGVYFALGAAFFLVYVLVDLVALCYGTRRDRDKQVGGCAAVCRAACAPRPWYVGAMVVLLAGAAAAIHQLGSFRSTINTTVAALNDFDALLSNTSAAIGGDLLPALSAVAGTLTSLRDAATAQGLPALAASAAAMLADATAASTATAAAATALNTTAASLDAKLHDTHLDVNQLGSRVYIGGVASLALFLALLLSSTAGLYASRCCAKFFKACNVLLVITLLLTYIFAGMFVAVAVVTSDICVAPSAAIASVAALAKPSADSLATLTYYTTCGGSAGVAPAGSYAQALNSSALLASVAGGLATANATYGGNAAVAPYFTDLAAEVAATNGSLNYVLAELACSPVYGLYATVLAALCTNGTPAIITVWALGTAGCVLIFVLVTSGARLCWRHPGDEDDKPEALSAAVFNPMAAPYGASYTAAPAAPMGSAASYALPPPSREWR